MSRIWMTFNASEVHVLSLFPPTSFFQDGLKTADKLKQYIEKLAADLYNVKLLFALVSSPAHYRVSFFIENNF